MLNTYRDIDTLLVNIINRKQPWRKLVICRRYSYMWIRSSSSFPHIHFISTKDHFLQRPCEVNKAEWWSPPPAHPATTPFPQEETEPRREPAGVVVMSWALRQAGFRIWITHFPTRCPGASSPHLPGLIGETGYPLVSTPLNRSFPMYSFHVNFLRIHYVYTTFFGWVVDLFLNHFWV